MALSAAEQAQAIVDLELANIRAQLIENATKIASKVDSICEAKDAAVLNAGKILEYKTTANTALNDIKTKIDEAEAYLVGSKANILDFMPSILNLQAEQLLQAEKIKKLQGVY